MPKTFSLDELFGVLISSNETPFPSGAGGVTAAITVEVSSPYYLIMLGTDGKFEPLPQPLRPGEIKPPADRPFVRGELHSYLARFLAEAVNKEEPEISDPTAVLSYSSTSVDVLKGPNTTGSDVGDRIARGVFLALRAAASGKKIFNITGHSRGAVECMFVMHELDRIKKALANRGGKTLREIVCDSCSTSQNSTTKTKESLEQLFSVQKGHEKDKAAGEDDSLLDLLRDRLNEFEVNAYLIDPVPGSPIEIPYSGFKAWRDPLFSETPPCKHYELLVCNDEQSMFFNPFIPRGWSFTLVDGHHGTPIGNIFTQTLEKLPESFKDDRVAVVQDLTLLKFIRFLTMSNKQFSGKTTLSIDLGHTELDALVKDYLSSSLKDRDKKILELYQETQMLRDKKTFEQYRSYSYIGPRMYDPQRFVHFGTVQEKVPLKTIPDTPEHANLTIEYLTGLSLGAGKSQSEPENVLERLDTTLKNLIGAMKTDPTRQNTHFDKILSNETVRTSLFNALSELVNSISKDYLFGISTKLKPKMLKYFIEVFSDLTKAINTSSVSDNNKAILRKFQGILQDGIKQTVEKHYKAISDDARRLFREIQIHLATPDEFKLKFTVAFRSFCLDFKKEKEEDEDFERWSKSVIEVLSAINPPYYDAIKEKIDLIIIELQSDKTSDSLKAKALEKLSRNFNTHLLPFRNARAKDAGDDYFMTLARLFSDTTELSDMYSQLKTYVGEKSIDINESDLFNLSITLPNLAGSLLKKKGTEIKLSGIQVAPPIPETILTRFNDLAKKQAVAQGAPSPELMAERSEHQTILEAANAAKRVIEEQVASNTLEIKELEEELRTNVGEMSKLEDELKASTENLETIIASRTTLQSELAATKKALQDATEEQLKLREEKALLITKVLELNQKIEELTKARQSQEQNNAGLKREIEKLGTDLAGHKMAESKLRQDVVRLKDAIIAAALSSDESQKKLEEANISIALLQDQLSSERAAHLQPPESHLDSTSIYFKERLQEKLPTHDAAAIEEFKLQIQQLNSTRESDSFKLIQDKLCPLTEKYLHHLLTQARKYDPTINDKNYTQVLPEIDKIPTMADSKKNYKQILNKYKAVSELYEKLIDTKQNPLPSKRIEMFNESLSKKAQEIKFRRDPEWPLYVKGCIAALVVATGIIPGLILYSILTGKSPLFFGTSGEKYIQDVEQNIPKPPPPK